MTKTFKTHDEFLDHRLPAWPNADRNAVKSVLTWFHGSDRDWAEFRILSKCLKWNTDTCNAILCIHFHPNASPELVTRQQAGFVE